MSQNRNSWTKEEDSLLSCLVNEPGSTKWRKISLAISKQLNTELRTGKQCRERWHNHLDPDIRKNAWSELEKEKILELHEKFGNRWSFIAKHLDGRTDNSVKNFFYSALRKEDRRRKREEKKSNFGIDKDSINILLQLSRDCYSAVSTRLEMENSLKNSIEKGDLGITVVSIIA